MMVTDPTLGKRSWVPGSAGISIYVKILGIGALVAGLFGVGGGYVLQRAAAHSYYSTLQRDAKVIADLLAVSVARSVVVDDSSALRQLIRSTLKRSSDVECIVVLNRESRELASTRRTSRSIDPGQSGLVVEAVGDILEGHAGSVHVGLSDSRIAENLDQLNRTFLWTLLACMLLGQALAVGLSYKLTRPVHHLVSVASAFGQGDYSQRASIFARDEIGRLARVFNAMATNVEAADLAVKEKEATRQSLMARLLKAQEEERRRISLELHDELGQSLSSLMMLLQSCQCDPKAQSRAMLEERISALGQDVRRMAFLLRPSILDDYGLNHALRRFVAESGRQYPFELDYQFVSKEEDARLPHDVEVALYRIVQEAVTNIARHAAATSASIVLVCRSAEIILVVEDDGKGMPEPPTTPPEIQGLGLAGMRERVAMLGGRFTVKSAPGDGVMLQVVISLERRES